MARAIGDQAIELRAMSVLGVDLATLGDIGGGIELLRGSVALANPADDPTIVPRAYANLGTVLEMGGFVEEALEVSLTGADQIARFGSELGFLTFLEVNAAAMLIELARYPEAAELLQRNVPRVLPGLGTIHLYTTLAHLAIRTGDLAAARRHLDTAEREAGGIADAQFVIDLCAFATEIALGAAIRQRPSRSPVTASIAWPRWTTRSSWASWRSRPSGPPPTSRWPRGPDGTRRAPTAAVDGARDVIERYRASTERLTVTGRARAATRSPGGWTCATPSCRAASGDDHPAHWAALRPRCRLDRTRSSRRTCCGARPRRGRAVRRPGRRGHGVARCVDAISRGSEPRSSSSGSTASPGDCAIDVVPEEQQAPVEGDRAGAPDDPPARRSVRPHDARTRGPRPRRRGLHEPAHRRRAVHQREHGRCPRLAHPRQARRRVADRGGHRGGQTRTRSARPRLDG